MPKCPHCNAVFEIKRRSNPQNSTWWGLIVTPLADFLGLTPEECHDLLKHKLNKEIIYVKDTYGNLQEIVKIKSTTTMTTVEHNDMCLRARIWASELGCNLKEPNEPEGWFNEKAN